MPAKNPITRLRAIATRFAKIAEDVTYAADEPDPTWSKRRRKVVEDANKPTHEAPVYIKAAIDMAANQQRIEAARPAIGSLNVVMIGQPLGREQWLQLAEKVNEATDETRRQLLDVKPEE